MKLITHRASDNDGYDGGWIARNGSRYAWGETDAQAIQNLVESVMPGDWLLI